MIPSLLVLSIVDIGVLGVIGLGVLLIPIVAIGVMRYRDVKDVDYSELRRNDPMWLGRFVRREAPPERGHER